MDLRIDDVDKRILYHLARDARHTSAPDIAAELDVSAPTIRNRTRRLEEAGVIKGYHADIDYERVEGRLTNLFRCSTTGTDRGWFARRVLEVAGVVNVREVMTGREDLLVTAIGTDTDEITRIARDIKALGVTIEDEDLVYREHFRPYTPFGPEDARTTGAVTGIADLPGDADVVEISVGDGAPIAGKTLREASDDGLLGGDVLLVTVERDDETLTPKGETTIRAGDRVTLLSRTGLTEETLQALTDR